MVEHKYGYFTSNQITQTKEKMRKQIYFLLLIADPKTKQDYEDVSVNAAFDNVLHKFAGMNRLLSFPQPLVDVLSLLEAALVEYNKPNFNFGIYRKLVLDAGAEVQKIEEV